jgi:hypothetical protein
LVSPLPRQQSGQRPWGISKANLELTFDDPVVLPENSLAGCVEHI